MLDTRLFEYIPESRTTRLFHYDDSTDTATIETVQDVTDLVSVNKAIFNGIDERARWHDGIGDRVASIPNCIYWAPENKHLREDEAALLRWINDSDNRCFRVRPGRV